MSNPQPQTLVELLETSAKKFPDRPAVSMVINYRTRTLTYSELLRAAQQTANWLKNLGIESGDTVLMNAPSSPNAVVLLFGVMIRGAVFVPLNTQSTPEMVRGIATSCEAKLLFNHSRSYADPELSTPTQNIDQLHEIIKNQPVTESHKTNINPDTLAQIMYTSGTTGEPKGVMLTHRNMLTTALGVARKARLTKKDRFLSILPLSHIYEQVVGLYAPLCCGGQIVYLHRPSALVSLMKEHRITKMAGVPEFLRILMSKIELAAEKNGQAESLAKLMEFNSKVPGMWLRRMLASSVHQRLGGKLTVVASGGSPLDAELEKKWNALGIQLLQGYGLTEVSGAVTMNTPDFHKEGSVGKPLNSVKLSLASDGEVCLAGPSVFRGYHQRKEATEAVLHDEVFHTGDIGEIDKDGFLFIRGRKKYMLKGPGGQNVYPEDIEGKLDAEPGIADSCVIGMESDNHLAIVAVVRAEEDGLDLEELQNRVNESLASYQRVNQILVWTEADFPRSSSKKIKRDPVKQWVEKALQGVEGGTKGMEGSKLARLVAGVTGAEMPRVQPQSKIVADLGLDSLMRVELVSRIELEFGVLIEETLVTPETTVEELEVIIDNTEPTVVKESIVRWPLSFWAQTLRSNIISPFLNFVSLIFFHTEVHGFENVKKIKGPCLIMPNHVNVLDSIVVARTLPRQLKRRHSHAAGADVTLFNEYKHWLPLVRLWLNAFSLPRKEDSKIEDGLRYVGWMLDRNYSVVIFPEGDTKEEAVILPIKEGSALLAAFMDVPVIPVYIENTADVMNPHGINIVGYFKKVKVWYGKPMYFKSSDDLEEVRMQIMMALTELRDKAEKYQSN